MQMTPSYTSPLLQKMTEKLIEDLQALEKWEAEFHPDKCSVIRITRKKTIHRYPYTLHGQILAEETNTKYLGVTIYSRQHDVEYSQ